MLSYITTRTQVKITDKKSVEVYYDKNIVKRTNKTSVELYYDKNTSKKSRQVKC